MSNATLAQLMYEQAQRALEQQERQVAELRQRAGTLLAATALIASVFGVSASGGGRTALPTVLGGASLVVAVLGALFALYPHRLDFATDARRLYDALASDQDDLDRVHLRLAFGLRDTRERNGTCVDRATRCLAVATVALITQIVCGLGF